MSRVISLNEIKNSAFLASESYKHAVDKIENSKTEILKNGIITNPATNSSFEVIDQINEKSKFFGVNTGGFSATVFKDTNTNEYVIAFRGSNDAQDFRDNLIMGATSTGLLGDVTNKQFSQAFAFASEQIARIQAQNPDAKISIAGHSLGGSLAQAVGAKLNMQTITFNAYGVKAYVENILNEDELNAAKKNILNIYNAKDPVSNGTLGGKQFGINIALDSDNYDGLDILGIIKNAITGYDEHLIEKLIANLDEVEHFLPIINIGLYDPIALDLNNNGKIDTLSLENGVFFDHNGDKIAFKSSWVNSSDGILARDINGDGKITSGAELFGNFTKLKNGELAKNGAQALKDLDDNNDGIFDSNDKAFNEILVWQDKNSDGISQKNELKTLNEHNIKSIDLEFMADNTALDKDNKQILIGSFSTNISNESKNNLASDIDFSVDTIQRNILDDTDGIIKGTGFVRNFNLSLNDEIKNAYESYKTLNTKQQQLSNVETLVNLWAKTAKQYKEIDNPIQKAKINISSVASGTTSSGINEAIKRAEAREITLSDGVKISA